ncbi:hypothetical protein AGMMS4957_18600 [Bacteroidia bacterium]|nr:hypothetical protein AGMMS4957_18600 [Bacteroidia bacterium]
MKKCNHQLVNWLEGMNVGDEHFRQLENYFIERLCDTAALHITKHNYGLLPPVDGENTSSEFDISEQVSGKVEIKLRRCNAITAGCCRIAYNPPPEVCLLHTHSFDAGAEAAPAQNTIWDVVLTVNPFVRIPTGTPAADELPPRPPHATEDYQLSVVPRGEIHSDRLGLHHLVIGRIRPYGGRYEVDTQYIPPCTRMSSHPDLLAYYERFGTYLNTLERSSKLILSKNRSHHSTIAAHVGTLSEDLMHYIATIYFPYRNMGQEEAPIRIVNYFSTLAHVCYVSLNKQSRTETEELLGYFHEWSDVTPGSFEELLANTLGIIYDHNALRTTMLQIETFLHILSDLWLKLSGLEYIGKHKDNIVVSERYHQQEQPKANGTNWSILD